MTINAQKIHELPKYPKDTTKGGIPTWLKVDYVPVRSSDTVYLDPPLSNINGAQEDTLIMVMYGHEVMRVAGGRVFINPYYFPRFPRWDWPSDSWYLIYDMARDKSTQIILNNKPKHKRK